MKVTDEQIERAKAVDTVDVANAAGAGMVEKNGYCVGCCRWHEDKEPSMAIYPDGHFLCFRCGAKGGDSISFYQQWKKVGFVDAVLALCGDLPDASAGGVSVSLGNGNPIAKVKKRKSNEPPEGVEAVLPRQQNPPTVEQLTARRYRVYVKSAESGKGVYVYKTLEGGFCHEVRFIDEDSGKTRSCMTIPSDDGVIFGMGVGEFVQGGNGAWYKIKKDEDPKGKRRWLKRSRPLLYRIRDIHARALDWPLDPGEPTLGTVKWVLNTEGPSDAEAGWNIGIPSTTSTSGATGLRLYEAQHFFLKCSNVAILQDADDAGKNGADKRPEVFYEALVLRNPDFFNWDPERLPVKIKVLPAFEPPDGSEATEGYDLRNWIRDLEKAGVSKEECRNRISQMITDAPIFAPSKELKARIRKELQAEKSGAKGKKRNQEKKDKLPDDPQKKIDALKQEADPRMTDAGNARKFREMHGRLYLYCSSLNTWLYWDKSRYKKDDLNRTKFAALETAESAYAEAAEIQDDEEAKSLARFAQRSMQDRSLEAQLRVARSLPELSVASDYFDCDPWMLNTPTGLLHLDTGKFMPHPTGKGPFPMVMHCTGTEYDPDAKCPRFRRFLEEVFVHPDGTPDHELIAIVKRWFGYCLAGLTTEHKLFFYHGVGANGKSVLAEIQRKLMGSYYQTLQFETLLHSNHQSNGPNEDLANLEGARVAVASEAPIGSRFSEGKVKNLTGGDAITAHRKYEHVRTFRASHKIAILANDPPSSFDDGPGFWRRIYLIPFRCQFLPQSEIDPANPLHKLRDNSLTEDLTAELPGILNWAYEGLMEWKARHSEREGNGLGECAAIRDATARYRVEQDKLAEFIEEQCIKESEVKSPHNEIYKAYKDFCEEIGDRPLGPKSFSQKLEKKGFVSCRLTGGGRGRLGIRLREPGEPRQSEREESRALALVEPAPAPLPFPGKATRPQPETQAPSQNGLHAQAAGQLAEKIEPYTLYGRALLTPDVELPPLPKKSDDVGSLKSRE